MNGSMPPVIDIVLATTFGGIALALAFDRAPLSSAAFLARIADGSFAERGCFYRAVRGAINDASDHPIVVLQGGLLSPPKRPSIQHEPTTSTGLQHLSGTLSLARGRLNSATGLGFFLCLRDEPALDAGGGRDTFEDGAGFAAFGHVVTGMSVARQIHAQPLADDADRPALSGQMLDPPIAFDPAIVSERARGFLASNPPTRALR